MNKKFFVIPFISLVMSGCGNSTPTPTSGPGPEPPVADTFKTSVASILSGHNYTAKVVTEIVEDASERTENTFYNINDKAFFYTDYEYSAFYTGYINQKDKGIVIFDLLKNNGTEIAAQNFVSTNPNLGVSMVSDFALEYVVNVNWQADNSVSGQYRVSTSTAVDANAIMLNFTPYDVRFVSSGEYVYGISINNGIRVFTDFTITYRDETTGQPVTDHGKVTVDITDIGNTHNSIVEAYIANPTREYTNPTDWTADQKSYFSQYFNNLNVPLIPSASYSLRMDLENDVEHRIVTIKGEDDICGDKREAWGSLFVDRLNFTKINDNRYQKQEEVDGGNKIDTYTVNFTYHSTTEAFRKGTIGDYYPNGAFYFEMTYTSVVNIDVNSVAALNQYLSSTLAKDVVPTFPETSYTGKITGFEDRTEYLNQLYDTDEFIFSNGLTSFFRLYISSPTDAGSYISTLESLFRAKGFTDGGTDEARGLGFLSDKNQSKFSFSLVNSTYPGYIQIQLVIRKGSIPQKPETAIDFVYKGVDWSSLDGYGELIGVDLSKSTLPAYGVPGETVTMTAVPTSGYQFVAYMISDELATAFGLSEDDLANPTITFTMPTMMSKSVTIGIYMVESVTPRTLESISVENPKLIYYQGDTFKKPTVYANYSNGDKEDVTNEASFSGFSSVDIVETQTITISYSGKSTTYDIQIKDGSVSRYTISLDVPTGVSIEITRPKGAEEYAVGASVNFKVNKGSVTITGVSYFNGTEYVVLSPNIFSGVYTFNMPNCNTTIKVSADDPEPVTTSSIAVSNVISDYYVGDEFIKPTVTATLSNGNTKDVTSLATFSGFNSNVAVTGQVITVSYDGCKTTFNVNIKERTTPATSELEFGVRYNLDRTAKDHYYFIFNSDGTGTYSRLNETSTPSYTDFVNFRFTYDKSTGKISVFLVSYGGHTTYPSSTDYYNGYRLFDADSVGLENNTGKMNADGTLSFSLCKVVGGEATLTEYTFTKVNS